MFVDGETLHVHKEILRAASGVFYTTFLLFKTCDLKEKSRSAVLDVLCIIYFDAMVTSDTDLGM